MPEYMRFSAYCLWLPYEDKALQCQSVHQSWLHVTEHLHVLPSPPFLHACTYEMGDPLQRGSSAVDMQSGFCVIGMYQACGSAEHACTQ